MKRLAPVVRLLLGGGAIVNYRRTCQAVEWAVLVAVVALHGLVYVQAQAQPSITWLQVAGDVQPLVAVTLLLAWGVLGPGRLGVRAVAAPILLIVWAVAVSGGDRRYFNPADSEMPLAFAIAIAMGLVFGIVRLFGLRMVGISAGRPEPRPQFSILALLTATTLIAVSIGGLELLRPTIMIVERDASYDDLVDLIVTSFESEVTNGRVPIEITRGVVASPATIRQCVLSLAIAGSAAGGLAMMLRPGKVWLRLAILAIALPTLGVYLTHLASTTDDEFRARVTEMAIAFAAIAALVGVSVLPLRLFGYRMLRGRLPDRLPAVQHAHANVGHGAPWIESVPETVR